MAPREFRSVCGKFATGITIATAVGTDGQPHGLTVNSFTSVSLHPPLVLICLDHRVRLLEPCLQSGYFGINILSEHQEALSCRFAQSGVDRFADIAWRSGQTGVPLLPEVLATLECRLVQTLTAGDHMVLIGEVLHLACREGKPLAYFGGAYSRVQPL